MDNRGLMLCLMALACATKSLAVFGPHWTNYMLWVIQQHEEKCWAPIVAPPVPLPDTLSGMYGEQKFFRPDLIVWDPIRQYPSIGVELFRVCYEDRCGSLMKVLCWQDGRKPRYTPRCLYGVSGFTILLC